MFPMARAIAVVLLFLPIAAANADDNLDLVQHTASAGKEPGADAAVEAQDLFSRPNKVLDSMMETSGELMKNFQVMREAEHASLDAQDRMFSQKLEAQRLENEAIAARTKVLKEQIANYEHATQEKRRQAQELSAHNEKSRSILHNMQEKLNTAKEFVSRSLSEVEVDSPDLRVLQELNDEDAQLNSVKEREQNLDAISAFGTKHASLLESTGQRIQRQSPSPKMAESGNLIKGIASSLAELQHEEQQGAERLKAAFMEKFKAEAAERSTLMKEQEILNGTLDSLVTLDSRLSGAVKHLQQTSDQLEANIHSAERFSVSIGGK